MSIRVDIISIGTLSRNLLWNETTPRRTQHATTSLIRAGKSDILVDPGLPAAVITQRLGERVGMTPANIHTVFLTHVSNATTFGLEAFEHARWLTSEAEIELLRERLEATEDEATEEAIKSLLAKLEVAPDKLDRGVDLFPLPGYTRGTAGLLISAAVSSTLVTGPAVASLDHFLAGQVLPESANVEQAKQSLQEIYEIADAIVPGFDNQFGNPRGFGI